MSSVAMQVVVYSFQVFLVFASATFVFDVIHFTLHQFTKSKSRFLRWVGNLHLAHHDYFDQGLSFNDELYSVNFIKHSLPEYLTQSAVCLAALTFVGWIPVGICLGLFTTRVIVSEVILRGRDTHHRPQKVISGRHGWLFVDAAYHALHHIHRDNYISSYTTLFDRIMGTSCQLAGRHVAMTGASSALGACLKRFLEDSGVAGVKQILGEDFPEGNVLGLDGTLGETDILIICDAGSDDMQTSCEAKVSLIERFKELTKNRRLPAEIWALGSGKETYQQSERAFARHARRYMADASIIYRHIVPSERLSGKTAAKISLFMIRRGVRYLPVTCNPLALLNIFNFFVFVKPAMAPDNAETLSIQQLRPESSGRQPQEEMAGALG